MARYSGIHFLLALGLIGGTALGQEEAPLPEIPALVTPAVAFIGITPCRIVDTRDAGRPPGYGPPSLSAGPPARSFTLVGQCGIPASAQAVSLNVTAVNSLGAGYLSLFPEGGPQPVVSTLNFSNRPVANAAIVPLGAGGGISVIAGGHGTDLLIDVNGYYATTAVDDTGNVFLGSGAGNTFTSTFNTGLGVGALSMNSTGYANTAFGYNALLSNTTGFQNTALGYAALASNTTGSNNSALGASSLAANTTGSENVAVGSNALASNVAGSFNTAVGYHALDHSTGSSNTALGYNAGTNLTSGDHNTYIGNPGASAESYTLRIGVPGLQTRFFIGGVYGVTTIVPDALVVFVDSTGKIGTQLSSARYKEDIRDMAGSSDALAKLRPVTFLYKGRPEARRQYGLIAEEVEEVFPELVVHDSEGNVQSVLYHELPAMLLNEWQKQQGRIEQQEAVSRDLQDQIAQGKEAARARQARIEELASRLAGLEGDQKPGRRGAFGP